MIRPCDVAVSNSRSMHSRREVDGRVEPERGGGLFDVVVDRFRDADHPQAVLEQVIADGERTISADRDQGIDAGVVDSGNQLR